MSNQNFFSSSFVYGLQSLVEDMNRVNILISTNTVLRYFFVLRLWFAAISYAIHGGGLS